MRLGLCSSHKFASTLAGQPNVEQAVAVDVREFAPVTHEANSAKTMRRPLHAGQAKHCCFQGFDGTQFLV